MLLVLDEDGPVPVVNVLFNGGLDSLNTVKFQLDNSLPVVVVKGSGGVADFLESAIATSKPYVYRHNSYSNSRINGKLL